MATAPTPSPTPLSRSISALRKHPFIASSFVLAISTPPIFRILLFFWPLIISTALCVLAVITFAPHSGGTAPFVEIGNESVSNVTVASQQVTSSQQPGLHSGIVDPSLMQVEENTWLEWLHNENCKQILAQSQAAASLGLDWENDNDSSQQVAGGSYRVLEQQTVSDEKIMVISTGNKSQVNDNEAEALSKVSSDPMNRDNEDNSRPEKDIHCENAVSSVSHSPEQANTVVLEDVQGGHDEKQQTDGVSQNTSSMENSKNEAIHEKSNADESFSFYPSNSSSATEEYSKNIHDQYGEFRSAKH